MLRKYKPYLVTAGVVLGVLVIYKLVKPYLPAAITNWLPI